MEAKEKANELFDRYKNLTTYQYQEYAGASYSTFEHDIDIIKQCALIAVQEILNCNPHTNPFNTDVYSTYDYWFQVKLEIEKL